MDAKASHFVMIGQLHVYRVLALLLAVSLLTSCAASSGQSAQPSYLVHVVLVWLKEPGNAEHRQQIIDASAGLRAIPGVLDLRVGEVVLSEREVVEDSYDVGLSLVFKDAAALQVYLTHPLHVQTVQQAFVPVMARYQVMDFAR